MLSGIEMIKIGVLDRLSERFKGIYGQETADFLAAAVVNELFCQKPSDPHAREFLTTNKDVIDRELSNLKYDDEICKVVTHAIRVTASLSVEQKNGKTESWDDHIDKLTKLGIFLPSEYTTISNLFLQIAHDFYEGK